MTTLTTIVTIQILVIGIIAFFTHAWFIKQRDPLFARYRIATVFLWFMSIFMLAMIIFHFAISSHNLTLIMAPSISFVVVFSVQRRLARLLKNRG
jgi:hypothetical protein